MDNIRKVFFDDNNKLGGSLDNNNVNVNKFDEFLQGEEDKSELLVTERDVVGEDDEQSGAGSENEDDDVKSDDEDEDDDDALPGGSELEGGKGKRKGKGKPKARSITDDETVSIADTVDLLSNDPLFLVLSHFFVSKETGDNIATILDKINKNLEKAGRS